MTVKYLVILYPTYEKYINQKSAYYMAKVYVVTIYDEITLCLGEHESAKVSSCICTIFFFAPVSRAQAFRSDFFDFFDMRLETRDAFPFFISHFYVTHLSQGSSFFLVGLIGRNSFAKWREETIFYEQWFHKIFLKNFDSCFVFVFEFLERAR